MSNIRQWKATFLYIKMCWSGKVVTYNSFLTFYNKCGIVIVHTSEWACCVVYQYLHIYLQWPLTKPQHSYKYVPPPKNMCKIDPSHITHAVDSRLGKITQYECPIYICLQRNHIFTTSWLIFSSMRSINIALYRILYKCTTWKGHQR